MMLEKNDRTLFPAPDHTAHLHDPAEIRQTIADRLRRVAEWVGSVSALAEEVGVNRTQLSRYLTGQSVPRPELLLRIAATYELPLDWLLKPHDNPDISLSEHQLSEYMYRMFKGRHFQLTENIITDGIYIVWKGLFQRPGMYEAYLASIKMNHGIGRIRTNMIRYLKRDGMLEDADLIDHVCGGIVMKSHSGLSMSFSDTEANIMASSFLRPGNTLRFAGTGLLSGFMTLHFIPGRRQLNIVPFMVEKVSPDCKSLLAAGRMTGIYERENLPEKIWLQIKDLDIPDYGLR